MASNIVDALAALLHSCSSIKSVKLEWNSKDIHDNFTLQAH